MPVAAVRSAASAMARQAPSSARAAEAMTTDSVITVPLSRTVLAQPRHEMAGCLRAVFVGSLEIPEHLDGIGDVYVLAAERAGDWLGRPDTAIAWHADDEDRLIRRGHRYQPCWREIVKYRSVEGGTLRLTPRCE